MSTNNIGFYEDLTKRIFQLSSNTHLIWDLSLKGRLLTSALDCLKDKPKVGSNGTN